MGWDRSYILCKISLLTSASVGPQQQPLTMQFSLVISMYPASVDFVCEVTQQTDFVLDILYALFLPQSILGSNGLQFLAVKKHQWSPCGRKGWVVRSLYLSLHITLHGAQPHTTVCLLYAPLVPSSTLLACILSEWYQYVLQNRMESVSNQQMLITWRSAELQVYLLPQSVFGSVGLQSLSGKKHCGSPWETDSKESCSVPRAQAQTMRI